jgi:hypothetical protein
MKHRTLPTKLIRRWLGMLAILSVVGLVGLSQTSNVMGQGVSTSGFGIGRGHGYEIGINLDVVNGIKADIAAGVYNRQCTAAEHDPTKWHSLVNIEAKCHYDHNHGDDPTYVNDIFGEPGGWFGRAGQGVSYPWQTFAASTATEPNDSFVANKRMENDLKHEGYMWVVRRDQPCPTNAACTTDFRVQFHGIFGAHDAPVRWHSFSYEGRVCQNPADASTCGIVRHGGWMDFGRLFVTRPDNVDCGHAQEEIFIPLSADTLYYPLDRVESRDEIRCHPTIVTVPREDSPVPLMEWWGLQSGRFRLQVRSYDPIGNINQQAPDQWSFFCKPEDMGCKMNQTVLTAFIGYIYVVPEFADYCEFGCIRTDPDGDKFTNFTGFTNRFGKLVRGCTGPGLDCVPIEYNHVRMNNFDDKEGFYSHHDCNECQRFDHDLSPAGQRWNTWFFTKYGNGGGHTEPTPQPTVQPTVGPTVQPTTQPTVIPEGAAVVIDVIPATAVPGQVVTLDVHLYQVQNLYGLQVECSVDPAVLTGAARTDGAAFTASNSFFIDSGYQPNGTWTVAASLLQPNAPISGTTKAFSLSYNVLSAGDGKINCEVLAVDANGNPLTVELLIGSYSSSGVPPQPTVGATTQPTAEVTAEPTVEPTMEASEEPTLAPTMIPVPLGTVAGVASYQNRPDKSGIIVNLYSIEDGLIGEITTDATGVFSFPDVQPGEYKLLFRGPQHIPAVVDASMADGAAVDVGSVVIHSGDTDDNGIVDVLDATFIGANFGVDAPPAPANADLNADLTVNITDLVLVGGNFGAESPINQAQQ